MATSIYGFARSVQSGSGATEALRAYDLYIKQNSGESGLVDDPATYQIAREKFLAPLANDPRVSVKIADSVNQENRLLDKRSDSQLASSVFKESVGNVLKDYVKQYYKNPAMLSFFTAYTYNQAVDKLSAEIDERKATGQDIGDMQNLLTEYSNKADKLTRLSRQVMGSGKPANPNAYGFFIKTNPDDGSIISIDIDSVDSLDKQNGYRRTESMYGNIPVWTNTLVDAETGKLTARIGNNKFETDDGKDDAGAKVLKLKGKQWGGFFKSLAPGGESPSENREKARNLNVGAIEFGDVLKLPSGSIAKDASGTYYYYGTDGVYKAESKDTLSKFLSGQGISADNIDNRAYPVSRSEVKQFGSFVGEDGKSRIIDEKFLGGVSAAAGPKPMAALPSWDQPVKGTFSAVPEPIGSESSTSPLASAKQIPRKQAAVKQPSQVGSASTADVIDQGKKFTLNDFSSGLRNIFRA